MVCVAVLIVQAGQSKRSFGKCIKKANGGMRISNLSPKGLLNSYCRAYKIFHMHQAHIYYLIPFIR
jgi:hypothetical protein